jgi:hydrogenase maturation protease
VTDVGGPGRPRPDDSRLDAPGPALDAPGPALDAPGPALDALGPPRGPAGGVLVIGYGNALRSDDGVGVHAAGLLARDPRLARVDVRAMVQLAPELAADFAEVSLAVLVDATVEAGPGQILVRQVDGEQAASADAGSVARPGPGATSHHVGVEELLALASELYGAAPEVVIVSVGVATMEVGDTLSPLVAAALPRVADAVADVVARHEGRLA